jgi:undecaprenyl-diphosphatase
MDQAVFHLINQHWTAPALDLFMAALSNFDIWKPFAFGIGIYVFIFGGFYGRAFVICTLVAVLLANQLLVTPIKAFVDRRRPKQVEAVRMVQLSHTRPAFLALFQRPNIRTSGKRDRERSGPSFPSGHMTNNTIIAVLCTLFFRRWGWLYFFVAGAVGYSRIYLGAHRPSDILATAFMAAGAALIMMAFFELIWKWAAPHLAPALFARHPRLLEAPDNIPAT